MRRCTHIDIRCIHGDEVNTTIRTWRKPSIARVRCLICNEALYGVALPTVCWYTGKVHAMEGVYGA